MPVEKWSGPLVENSTSIIYSIRDGSVTGMLIQALFDCGATRCQEHRAPDVPLSRRLAVLGSLQLIARQNPFNPFHIGDGFYRTGFA